MSTVLTRLPRDSRDTLFLLVIIGWLLLPHIAHLPPWCTALAAAVLAWRGWLAWAQRPLPARGWLWALLALTVVATLATHRTLLGREAGVTLIVVLLALKTLELRARRDAFVVFFLGFFTLLTNFFYSQSLTTALAMLLGLLGLLTALVNSHLPSGRPPLALAAWLAARMMLLGAPIMVLLFLLFPRLTPLWGTPSDALSGRSGLSARMQVGQIAQLALDDSVALRVRFDGGVQPPQGALYFRGPVLSTFDGREWLPLRSEFLPAMRPRAELQTRGPALTYEVTLEPQAHPWLLTLDATPQLPELPPGWRAQMGEDLQWVASGPIVDRLRYRATAHLQFRHGPLRAVAALHDELALPAGLNPRTLQWAQRLRRDHGAQPPAIVEAALQQLRTGGYVYTLEPGEYGAHTADEFWFDRKAGFCEHIASAFAVLMRAAGIPARVVTGYQGGERNTLDDYWIVRQSDAHAWTEIWLAGQGWVRVDPTAAVAPARTGSLQRLQMPRGALAQAVGTVVGPGVAAALRAAWDALNHTWNQYVLNYTQSRQLELLRQMGFAAPGWEDLVVVLGLALTLAAGWGVLWALRQRSRNDPWQRLLQQARRRLQRLGSFPPGVAATPRELAERLAQLQGPQDNRVRAIQAWLQRLEQARYARRTPAQAAAEIRALRRDFRRLDWPP